MKFYETYDYQGIGYQKLFHHQNWRVAILNYIDELDMDKLAYVEAHSLTDEVFVLLEGECHLFFVEVTDGIPGKVECLPMKKNVIYKIPMGIYHTHTLSKDAHLLIVEEENTSYENSPRVYMTDDLRQKLIKSLEDVKQ